MRYIDDQEKWGSRLAMINSLWLTNGRKIISEIVIIEFVDPEDTELAFNFKYRTRRYSVSIG
jgi:hypothetical protein